MRTRRLVLPAATLLSFLLAAPAAAIQYDLTRVSGCGDPALVHFVGLEAINESGVAVGVDEVHDPVTMNLLRVVAITWSAATGTVCLEDLPGGSEHAWAHDINDDGDVVGHCSPAAGGWVSCIWPSGSATPTPIGDGDLPGGATESKALAINNAGQVIGYGYSANGREAYLFENGVMTGLGDLDGGIFASAAFDLDDAGRIVGYGTTGATDDGWSREAVLWSKDASGAVTRTVLGPSQHVEPRGINGAGLIVGASGGGYGGAVIWEGDAWVSAAMHSQPAAVSDNGQVVGGPIEGDAFVWDRYNGSKTLHDLLREPALGLLISRANDINEAGTIVGHAMDYAGGTTYPGVVFTPVPPFDGDGDGRVYYLDCNDADPAAYPGAPETCDGLDNDCNGLVDEAFDGDGDGFAACSECNDAVAAIHPGAAETVGDGVDQDCNGYDLTIVVKLATWSQRQKTLTVQAASGLQAGANLAVDGAPMVYSAKKKLWSLVKTGVAANPGSVTVSGVEGAAAPKTVTTVR